MRARPGVNPWLTASLLVNVVLAVVLAPRVWQRWTDRQQETAEPPAVLHRTTLFDGLTLPAGAIVFAGDSLVQMCEWSELLGDSRVVNRGIFGETVTTLRAHAGAISRGTPAAVFLMVGINDLAHDRAVEAVVDDYAAMLRTIASPATRVVVQGVLPVNRAKYGYPVRLESIAALNLSIKALAATAGAIYIDVGRTLMNGSGELDERYTADGVHLTGEGYRRWRDALTPVLSSLPPPVGKDSRP